MPAENYRSGDVDGDYPSAWPADSEMRMYSREAPAGGHGSEYRVELGADLLVCLRRHPKGMNLLVGLILILVGPHRIPYFGHDLPRPLDSEQCE
jgi:hypothetical protein